MAQQKINDCEGIRKLSGRYVNLSNDMRVDCIDLIKVELQRNHEWIMELRKRVGLQSLIWPFVVIGAAISSKVVNLSGLSLLLEDPSGIFFSMLLLISFLILGIIYGFLEKRLWERQQYLRRMFMTIVENNLDELSAKAITLNCMAEIDYKCFDSRGAYLMQYALVACMAISTLALVLLMVTPKQ